jgi:hypothetical protein
MAIHLFLPFLSRMVRWDEKSHFEFNSVCLEMCYFVLVLVESPESVTFGGLPVYHR